MRCFPANSHGGKSLCYDAKAVDRHSHRRDNLSAGGKARWTLCPGAPAAPEDTQFALNDLQAEALALNLHNAVVRWPRQTHWRSHCLPLQSECRARIRSSAGNRDTSAGERFPWSWPSPSPARSGPIWSTSATTAFARRTKAVSCWRERRSASAIIYSGAGQEWRGPSSWPAAARAGSWSFGSDRNQEASPGPSRPKRRPMRDHKADCWRRRRFSASSN